MGSFDGEIAFVTGGSGGIGAAICLALGREGAKVAVGYHTNAAGAQAVVDQILAAKVEALVLSGKPEDAKADAAAIEEVMGQAVAVQGDVADPSAAKIMIDCVVSALGGLDILVNNAGIARDNKFPALTDEDWEISWQTNFMGPARLCKAALRGPMKRNGNIINIASVIGLMAHDSQAAYGATKAALIHLTKTLAAEYGGKRGTRVNVICPGYIRTPMTEAVGEALLDTAVSRQLISRVGLPEDVASMVVFLAADASSFITGEVHVVSGGLR